MKINQSANRKITSLLKNELDKGVEKSGMAIIMQSQPTLRTLLSPPHENIPKILTLFLLNERANKLVDVRQFEGIFKKVMEDSLNCGYGFYSADSDGVKHVPVKNVLEERLECLELDGMTDKTMY